MKQVDRNRSGMIELGEFIAAFGNLTDLYTRQNLT